MTFRSSKATIALGRQRTADTAAHAIALQTLADKGQLQTAHVLSVHIHMYIPIRVLYHTKLRTPFTISGHHAT